MPDQRPSSKKGHDPSIEDLLHELQMARGDIAISQLWSSIQMEAVALLSKSFLPYQGESKKTEERKHGGLKTAEVSTKRERSRIRKCEVCSRNSEQTYCQHHYAAYLNLKNKYPDWSLAFGEVTWEMYLESVIALEETGDWVRQVAKNELSKSNRQNLKRLTEQNRE